PVVVVDTAPVRRLTASVDSGSCRGTLLAHRMCEQKLLTRHLIAIIEVVDRVEDLILVVDIDDLPVRKDLAQGLGEDLPFVAAVEVVTHEESAAQQELPEARDLRGRQFPVPDLDRIEPRIIEAVLVLVEVNGLLYGAGVDASQTANSLRQVAVGARIVNGP